MILRTIFFFCLALCCAPLPAQDGHLRPDDSAVFKSLFNGTDLTGWDGDMSMWSVKDGAIHGQTTKENAAKGNTFLILQDDDGDATVKDFELRITFRCNAVNNSGIQYRSAHLPFKKNDVNKWVLKGYQHEIRNENEFPDVPGFIYDEKGRRGRICQVGEKVVWGKDGKQVIGEPLINQEQFKKLMKLDDWNEVIIIAKGNHIQHYLNGRRIVDFTDNEPKLALSEGVLGLQLHAGAPMWTEFKDIRIRELK